MMDYRKRLNPCFFDARFPGTKSEPRMCPPTVGGHIFGSVFVPIFRAWNRDRVPARQLGTFGGNCGGAAPGLTHIDRI